MAPLPTARFAAALARVSIRTVCSAAVLLALVGTPFSASGQEVTLPERPLVHDGSFGTGFKVTPPEGIARSPRFRVRAVARGERPRRVLLTEFLPPVGNQGRQGSCAGWATAYYCYTYAVARQRKLTSEQRNDAKFQFSPAFLYHSVNGGKDEGSRMRDIFDVLAKQGCASLAEMPYDQNDFTSAPPAAAVDRAARYKARETACLFAGVGTANPEALKTFLAEIKLPIVIGIPIFPDFPRTKVASDFVYNGAFDKPFGGHAICIVGYDEDLHAFRMVNSWGKGWGDDGFLWLHEDFVRKYGLEGWGQLPGGVVAREVRRGSSAATAPPAPIQASAHVVFEWPKP